MLGLLKLDLSGKFARKCFFIFLLPIVVADRSGLEIRQKLGILLVDSGVLVAIDDGQLVSRQWYFLVIYFLRLLVYVLILLVGFIGQAFFLLFCGVFLGR